MKIQTQKKISSKKGVLVAPVFMENLKNLSTAFPEKVKEFILNLVKEKEFKAKKGEVIYTYLQAENLPHKLLIVGLGSSEKYNGNISRRIGAKISKIAKQHKNNEITLILIDEMIASVKELLEGFHFAQYKFDFFKTSKKENGLHKSIDILELITDKKFDFEGSSKKAQMLAEGMNFTKDLINSPSNYVDAKHLTREARKIAKDNRYEIEVFGKKELEKMGWG